MLRSKPAVAVLAATCLGVVGLAIAGRTPAAPGLQFATAGHWVYTDSLGAASHVDGSTGQVDARARIPGAEDGSQVVQGDRSGYVVGRSKISIFGKSTLSVEGAATPPANEQPVVMEIAGGPYLVYRNAGQLVRLGDPTATMPAGGPVSGPVATRDGTVWLHRIDSGALCQLARGAQRLSCPAQVPAGHSGALAVVDDRPVLLDTTAAALRAVDGAGLGEPVPTGVELSADVEVASGSVEGRLVVTDPARHQLLLIDTAGLDRNRPAARTVTVDLPKDTTFSRPVAAGNTVVLVDETRSEVSTYDSRGTRKGTKHLPSGAGKPRLSKGEDDRVYVDNADGSHMVVVNGGDGSVLEVNVVIATPSPAAQAPPPVPPASGAPAPQPGAGQPGGEPPASVPGAPGNVRAVGADRSVTVSWAPAASNGSPVKGYVLSWSGGSTRVGGAQTSATLTGLANGTSYVITVAAENAVGRGAGVSASARTPSPPPTVQVLGVTSPKFLTYVTTVNADGMGLDATCQATMRGVSGAQTGWVPCGNGSQITMSFTSAMIMMPVTMDVTVRTGAGTATGSWTGTP